MSLSEHFSHSHGHQVGSADPLITISTDPENLSNTPHERDPFMGIHMRGLHLGKLLCREVPFMDLALGHTSLHGDLRFDGKHVARWLVALWHNHRSLLGVQIHMFH